METEKFVPKWEWVRVVEETPDYIDVKLRIKDPETGRLTALFINTFREKFKLPISVEALSEILEDGKRHAGLDATTIRINKAAYKNMSPIKDIIAVHTAKLKKFCIYVDKNITEYINENSIYNWCWQLAVFNRFTEKFEPVADKKDTEDRPYEDMASLFEKLAGEQDD